MLQLIGLQFQLARGALEFVPVLRQYSVTGMAAQFGCEVAHPDRL